MSIGGVVGIDIFTILSLGGVIAISPLIKKVTNNWFFWIGLCGLIFLYGVLARFGHDWSVFSPNPINGDHDYIISKGLLLDICPFTFVFLMISCIVDPTRRAAKIAAPFAIFGGLITILGGASDMQDQSSGYSFAHFIFLGSDGNEMYFMMHYLMIVVGGLVFVSTPRTHLADWIYCNGYAAIYYSYVAIIMTQMNVYENVSGLCVNDWSSTGEYSGVASFLNLDDNHLGGAIAFGFVVSYIFISLFIYLQSKLQNARKHPRYDFGWCANWTNDIKKRFLIGWYDLKPEHPIFVKKFFTVQKQTW